MTRRVLAAAFATTVLAFGATAEAESRFGVRIVIANGHDHDRYARPRYDDDRGYGESAYRVGYSRGWDEGFDHGRDDAEDRDGFNFWHDKDYRKADKGYRDHYGPRWSYERGFRAGYEEAYRRAYSHFERRHDHGRCGDGYYAREIPRYRYSR